MMKTRIICLASLLFAFGNVFADPIISVDFRGSDWDAADYSDSFTVDGVTASAQNSNEGLYHDNVDGLGIRGGADDDEIDGDELLSITLEDGYYDSHGLIDGFFLTDLFQAPDGGDGESGWVDVFLAGNALLGRFDFHMTEASANGEYWVAFGGAYEIYQLIFGSDGRSGNEYSLAGLTSTPSVPEPGTMALLGLGLLMLAVSRRRRTQGHASA